MSLPTTELVNLSQRLLVASDQSYAGKQLVVDESALFRLDDAPLFGRYQPPFETYFPDYVATFTYEDPATGFKGAVYRNESTREVIVALAGTDGTDLQDWWSNLTHYGWNQWKENRVEVLRNLDTLITRLQGPGGELPKIHFTGQSLGGALAQYAAYEFVETHDTYAKSQLSLVTFNGLGGVAALREELPRRIAGDPIPEYPQIANSSFDPSVVAGFGQVAHYGSLNDLIWRAGAGHLGGNVYSFAGLDFANIDPVTNEPFLLDTISAHKIETGFYYPLTEFDRAAVSGFDVSVNAGPLSQAQLESKYLKVDKLQKLSSILGNVFRQSETSSSGAMLKLLFGGMGGFTLGDSEQVNHLIREYVKTRKRAGKYLGKEEEYEAAKDTNWSLRMRIAAAALGAFAVPGPFGLIMKVAGAIAFAPVYQLLEGISNDSGELVLRQSFEMQRQGAAVPDASLEEALQRSTLVGAALDTTDPSEPLDLDAIAELVEDDVEGFAEAMVSGGEEWYSETAEYLATRAIALGKQDKAQSALNEFWTYSRQAADSNPTLLASVSHQFGQFTTDWTNAVANLSDDLVAPRTTPLEVTGLNQYAQKRTFWNSVLAGLENVLDLFVGSAQAAETHQAVTRAIENIRASAETVVIRSGRSANPFDDPSLDPESAPVAAGALEEGSVSTFTVYLPYEAGDGGQRVKLELAGASVDELSVLAGGDDIELEADGTFTVTVAEGQRETTFSIVAGADLDADATLTLSATLVDESGEATHLEHEEAMITLDAETESAPVGGREIRGDWAPKPYTDPDTGQTYYAIDDLWNIERLPGVPNTTAFEEPDSLLQGSTGPDHIVTGDYDDRAYGFEGDDAIIGSDVEGAIFLGGAGNDWIEAGRYDNHVAYYYEFERYGRTVKHGEDQLYGGPGDDQIFGEYEATQDALYDPTVTPTGRPGDWISGGSGADKVFGGAGDDVLMGGLGEDRLVAGAGMDVLLGDDDFGIAVQGNFWRVVHPNFGDSTPGFGNFEFGLFPVYNYYPNITTPAEISPNTQDPYVSYYKEGGGADVLIGGAGKDILIGQLGDDTLYGGADDDLLAGWEGADQVYGGEGNDRIAGEFGRYEQLSQRIISSIELAVPGLLGAPGFDGSVVDQVGNDLLDGGGGNDLIFGEGGNDVVIGGEGADTLFGDATYLPHELHGDDILDGGAGDDFLAGNAGNDKLYGGDGVDDLSGGPGSDVLEGGIGNDVLTGDEGDDTLRGGEGTDRLSGAGGADQLYGGGGDDQLDGGDDEDVLFGDAGADQLDGGGGTDTLYGGSGEDVVQGGDGDDAIDGGAGVDILRGGAGDDTYAFGLGYGQDLIEDSEGSNRLSFGAGIAPDDLSATLDGATLSATIVFGGAGDSATLNMSAFQVGGVDFAGGATWGRKEFLGFMPALASAGSDLAEVLVGNENLRNELRGLAGDDNLIGSANDDLLDGGVGADGLDGGGGSDVYVFTAADSGIDALADSELQARAYLDWYYDNLDIPDWIERGQYGGKYKAVLAGWGITLHYDSFDEAFADFSFAEISLVERLPSVAPLVRRDDHAALDELVAAGVLSRDIAEFGPGLSLSDLTLSITVNVAGAADHPEQPWYSGGTLSVGWESGGFDLEVPGVAYGFVGANLLTDGSDPELDIAGAWRGYRLGEGIETFRFADGSTYALEQVLQQATVVELIGDYAFSRGSGAQLISRNYPGIVFDAGIRSDEVEVSRDGTDLILSLTDGSAQGRIAGWYSNPTLMPTLSLSFSEDPQIDAATLTEMGLEVAGSDDDDVIVGLDGFDDLLSGGAGNDILDGGTGKDTYVFNRGDGIDIITDAPSDAGGADASVVVLGAGIEADDVQLTLGSLVVDLGGGDEIHFSAFDAADPYSAPVFGRLEFDDGSSISYEEVLENGFEFYGTDGDDVISGTGAHDVIDGEAGNDMLSGLGGEDYLEGSEGDDTLLGGSGDGDAMAGQEGNDTYVYAAGDGYDYVFEWDETPGELDTVEFTAGIAPTDVRVTRDDWSYYLVFDGTDRLVLDSMAKESAAVVERVEFGDGTVWTPADLAARVELLPGTPLNDALWGTAGNDILEGLGGDDSLFGNGGSDILIGGEGSDYYYFAAGDGADRVDNFDSNPDSWDSIRFVDAVSSEVSLAKSGSDLVLHLGDGGDRVTLIGWYADEHRKIDSISFDADGGYWDAAMLEQMAPSGGNSAPELSNPIADQTADEDSAFTFTVPGDTFSDADAGDTLTYGASLADGSVLPAWLTFDPASRIFSGTPVNADVGAFEVTVTAADASGESASDTFRIEVLNTNDAPATAGDTAGVQEDGAPTAAGDVLANDIDVDAGTVLAVAAPGTFTGGYGTLLLASDGVYTYALDNAAIQSMRGGATVEDIFGYAASDGITETPGSLTVTITGANDAPVPNDDAANVEEDGAPAGGNVLANDMDVDADTMLTVTNPGTYAGAYGTLTLGADGGYVYALDNAAAQSLAAGQSVSDTFGYVVADDDATPLSDSGQLAVSIAGVNDAPVLAGALFDQSGCEGQGFSFTVPSGTFADVDSGDSLTLSASLADGAALPSWLAFENGVFSGTPGLAEGGEYLIQVTATDTASASVATRFNLAVSDSLAVGNRLIGTRRDDVLNGNSAGELLEGRGGADRLLAGGGDDVLRFFADDRVKGKNRSHDFFDGGAGFDTLRGTDEHDVLFLDDGHGGPRLAGIEYVATGEGHDLVDLRSGRFGYGDVVLDGGEGHDVLQAAGGNDLLLGGKGNDELSGGGGQDIYIHGLRGGNDEIDEAGITGETDILRFGEGITRGMVRARRHHDDLVLDVAGPHGSVTVKGWFASEAQRVERIEFADGTAWDERIMRQLVRQRHDDDWHDEKHWPDDRHDERRNRAPQERGDRRDERAEDRDEGAAAIPERPWQKSCFDFETLARELDRSGKHDEALSTQEIARRWAAVHRYTSALALEADEHADHGALTGWQSFAVPGLLSASGFGFEASIGAARGPESLKSLEGLNEGFRKL